MRMKFKKSLLLMVLAIFLVLTTLSACSGKQSGNLLKKGTYATNGDINTQSSVTIEEDDGFLLFGPPMLSYAPNGKYTIKDDKLYLPFDEKEHIFLIKDDVLIFESGEWLENWIEKGTEFHLKKE